MPEEFAAAYQAAYEQALSDYDVAPRRHRDPAEGSTRGAARRASDPGEDAAPHSWFERLRDTHWFVPVLLAVLVLLLILGAYGIGKAVAGQVDAASLRIEAGIGSTSASRPSPVPG